MYSLARRSGERKRGALCQGIQPNLVGTAVWKSPCGLVFFGRGLLRTPSALHAQVCSEAVRFDGHTTQVHVAAMTTVVTTEQVQISYLDATLHARGRGDRTSIAVLDGAVQVSALELTERYVYRGRNWGSTSPSCW